MNMSISTCNHTAKIWGFNPFGKNKEPTKEEINIMKLYKCSSCGYWYSVFPESVEREIRERARLKPNLKQKLYGDE